MFNKLFKMVKRTGLVAGLILVGLSADAQTLASGSLTNGANLIRSGATVVHELQVLNRDVAAAIVTLYDNSSATSTNRVKTGITTYTLSRATNSTTFTNFVGVVETNNFIYMTRSSTVVAAVTNEATRVYRVTVPASSSVLIQPDDGYGLTFGYQLHWTGTNADYNTIYRTLP